MIGITTAAIEEGQNLNFAIPIDYAKGMLISSQPRSLALIYEAEPAPKNFHITTPPPPGERQPEAKPTASNPEGKALAAKLAAALGGETKLQSIKAIASTYTRTPKTSRGDVPMSMQSTVVFPDLCMSKVKVRWEASRLWFLRIYLSHRRPA